MPGKWVGGEKTLFVLSRIVRKTPGEMKVCNETGGSILIGSGDIESNTVCS